MIRRHPHVGFCVLAVGLSWAYWIPLAVWAPDVSHVPGLAGPAVAAVIMVAVIQGRAGVVELWQRIARWRVRWVWYLLAGLPLVTGAIGLGLAVSFGADVPTATELAGYPGVPQLGWLGVFVMVLLVNGYGEEVGWRGFLWPTLRRRDHSMARTALYVAGPWAAWHLPLFWIDSGLGDLGLLTVPGWLIGLTAGSLVLGWLYERSGSSLLIVSLFHACLNMASATEATAGLPAAVTSAVVIVGAIFIGNHEAARSNGRPVGTGTT